MVSELSPMNPDGFLEEVLILVLVEDGLGAWIEEDDFPF